MKLEQRMKWPSFQLQSNYKHGWHRITTERATHVTKHTPDHSRQSCFVTGETEESSLEWQ